MFIIATAQYFDVHVGDKLYNLYRACASDIRNNDIIINMNIMFG